MTTLSEFQTSDVNEIFEHNYKMLIEGNLMWRIYFNKKQNYYRVLYLSDNNIDKLNSYPQKGEKLVRRNEFLYTDYIDAMKGEQDKTYKCKKINVVKQYNFSDEGRKVRSVTSRERALTRIKSDEEKKLISNAKKQWWANVKNILEKNDN